MIKKLSLLLLIPLFTANSQEVQLPVELDFSPVRSTDLQYLRTENFENVLAQINSKNPVERGTPEFFKDQIRRSIHFAFEARNADRDSGVGAFARWLTESTENEISAFKGRIPDEELSGGYFVLAGLNELVVRDPKAAKRLYLEGLKPWMENLSEASTSAELNRSLETLEGEPRAALLKYIRLVKADEYEAQRQEGFALQRAIITETENQK